MKGNDTRLFIMSHIMIPIPIPFPYTLQAYVCWDPLSKASQLCLESACGMPRSLTRTSSLHYDNRISIFKLYFNINLENAPIEYVIVTQQC